MYNMATEYELRKIIMVGDFGVGKTSLLNRYIDNEFEVISTDGFVFKYETVDQDKKIKLQIWDTNGQEEKEQLQPIYFREAHGVLLVYDVTNMKSFEKILEWMKKTRELAAKARIILVGNKSDLADKQVVKTRMGKKFARKNDLLFIETSVENDVNIDDCFSKLVREIMDPELSTGDRGGGEVEESSTPCKCIISFFTSLGW